MWLAVGVVYIWLRKRGEPLRSVLTARVAAGTLPPAGWGTSAVRADQTNALDMTHGTWRYYS